MKMIIDTHCHLSYDEYEDVEKVISNMKDNIMICSGATITENDSALFFASKYKNIYATIGFHPDEAEVVTDRDLNLLEEKLSSEKVVGIGEIGLDYHYDDTDKELQKKYFIEQIKIAKEYNKTIVIHSRDAVCDTYDILNKYIESNKVTLHCYGYDKGWASKFKKFNMKFGIGGVLTFKNAKKLVEVVNTIDLEDMLLETDSPYLTPEPFRGKTNEPYNIIYVAKKIAELKNVSTEKVLEITTKNAIEHFDLDIY